MSEQESSPATAQAEAVEELLRQLVDARFVLTDRDGAVTRWSRPAEELFGWPNARMLGRPLFETLGVSGELPELGGVVQTVARRKDGSELELTLTLVPVGMSQSLEFNGFLEALEIAAPRGNALQQLQRSHRTVVDWVHAAMRGEARLDEEDLAAGTIVAFRPLIELPPPPLPVEEEPEPGAAATAAAAGQIADAVEAALGRSDELERALEGTTAELEQTRGEAEAARGEIARTTARLAELDSQLAEARRALEEMRAGAEEAREERDRTRTAVEATRELAERLERELAGTPQAQEQLSAKLEETRATVAELRATRERVEALEAELARERAAVEETRAATTELRAMREKVEALETGLAKGGRHSGLESELSDTRARVEQLEAALASAPRGAVDDAADGAAAALRDRVETLARELARLRDADSDAGVDELNAKLAALERAVGDEHERSDEARRAVADLREELAELRSGGVAAGAFAAGGEAAPLSADAVAAIERITARAEQAADAARTQATRATDASGEAEARASRAEQAAERVDTAIAQGGELASRAEQAAERADAAIAQGSELTGRIETDIARAGEAAATVERSIERAEDAAATVERNVARAEESAAAAKRDAERVDEAAGRVQAAVQRSAEVAAEVEAQVARVDERAAGIDRQAERAEAAETAAERHVGRADEAAGLADRHADRAGEQAGAVEETARKLGDATAAADRAVERAAEAAEAAKKAAEMARQAADEAGATVHGHREELRQLSRFEGHAPAAAPAGEASAPPARAPLVGGGHAQAPPEPAGNGGDPVAEPSLADRPRKPLFGNRAPVQTREERPGFDDVKQPKATIALDGRFQELNRAFSDLVGYSEGEFQQAVWPPVMDRANLDKHREQMKDMLAGKIESAEIKTGYVHAQGLLVPVVGTLTLVRENGEPSHFLLETS